MNVMKNDFHSKLKRMRHRNSRNFKAHLLGQNTVFNNIPHSLNKITRGNEIVAPAPFTMSSYSQSTGLIQGSSFIEEILSPTLEVTAEDTGDETSSEYSQTEYVSTNSTTSGTESPVQLQSFFHEIFSSHMSSADKVTQKRSPIDLTYENEELSFKKFRLIDTDTSHTKSGINFLENLSQPHIIRTESRVQPRATNFQINKTPEVKSTRQSCQTSISLGKTPTYSSSYRSHNRTSSKTRSPSSGEGFSESNAGSYVLSVTEGRGHARGEVGIAALDPRRPHLILCQISDNQRYVNSLTKMNIFNITEIIMPTTFTKEVSPSKLYLDIREHFPTTTITSVQRRHFSETAGLELISQYCSPESGSVMVLVKDKFYALAAVAALVKYVEYSYNVLFAPRSVKVEYQGTEDTMIIDFDTANRLELVVSRINGESITDNTLLGVMKHCHTKGGVRLLRANILQPPCSLEKIESRLNCVTELISKPLLFVALEAAVSSFSNVENLLTLCMHEPQQDGLRAAEFQLKYVLLLKTTLELLPTLIASLEEATSDYFCKVRENLQDLRYKIILDRILEIVSENAKTVKGSAAAHLHACFAIKTGINGLLDIAKKTYCEIVQEIWDHVHLLKEKHNMQLKMSFTTNRGFHIQYTVSSKERNLNVNLPKEFILVQKTKSTYYFYTSKLVALDQRSQQVLNEVKMITNVILFEMLNDIRQHVGCLYNLCEYISELDMIASFAHVGSAQNYVRPQFGDSLNVTKSRHPILDVIHDGKIVSNDIFAENGRNFVVLTGPNQSGKSIYISQIALLQVMAQIGCYVPATSATFRITDRIFSRIGFDDSGETNASTLIAEMRDMEYVRQNITPRSLIIIDELCRGTSVDEGTSLAFIICEDFLDTSAFVFVTTHYIFLTKLEEMYFNVTNYHFESEIVTTGDGNASLRFSHEMVPGVTKAEQYGLTIAELTSFPKDILTKANEIAKGLLNEKKPLPEVNGLTRRYRISQELSKEMSDIDPNNFSSQKEAIIIRYKTLLLNLNCLNGYNFDFLMESNGKECLKSSYHETNSLKSKTLETLEKRGKLSDKKKDLERKRGQVLSASKNIKKKYTTLRRRTNAAVERLFLLGNDYWSSDNSQLSAISVVEEVEEQNVSSECNSFKSHMDSWMDSMVRIRVGADIQPLSLKRVYSDPNE